jgi:hypothetical protein
VQQCYPGIGQRNTRRGEKLPCFLFGKAQIRGADFGQLARQAQLVQTQLQIAARRQYRVRIGGKVCQQRGELGERIRRRQLMEIVDARTRRPGLSASSDSTRSIIARPLKSGVVAGASARPVGAEA